jgi:hypothetical protein
LLRVDEPPGLGLLDHGAELEELATCARAAAVFHGVDVPDRRAGAAPGRWQGSIGGFFHFVVFFVLIVAGQGGFPC